MKRLIVTPPALPPAALAELKQWLAIAGTRDDAGLAALLRAGLDLCEAFTGAMPLESACEELLPVNSGWQELSARPVQAITAALAVPITGPRTALAAGTYEIELDAAGAGRVRLLGAVETSRIAVRYTAGLAPNWDALPEPLRHGVIRLAAHQHREREGSSGPPMPPAAVAALWRPWRRMRLA